MKTVTYDPALYRLVPINPDEKMLDAGQKEFRHYSLRHMFGHPAVWAAMLAASPEHPEALPVGWISLKDRVLELIDKHDTLRAAARAIQIDPSYLSRIEHGEKDNLSDLMLRRMGLRKIVAYERIGPAPITTTEGGEHA